MCRNYNITKYKGNTHYTVNVTDSFGQEHTSFFETVKECGKYIIDIWENEVKKPEDLLSKAITNCIEIDKRSGILKENSDGLD
tara:strand:+ start:179 stop:427 length:249 start_codon:yes stop_codon:yes gene_type:complete